MIKTVALAALLAALASPVLAQEAPESRGQWGFLLGAATDNRSKGVSKSDKAPYVYGVAEWSDNADFLYLESGFETIDSSTGSNLELAAGVGVAEWSDNADFLYLESGFETIDSSTGSNLELAAGVGVRPQVMGFDLDLNLTGMPDTAGV